MESEKVARQRATTNIAMCTGKQLAARIVEAIEDKGATISDAVANGLAMWLEEQNELELAAMLCDGRGTKPRYPMRLRG